MKLNGSEIIVECLKEQGVDTIFGYPGGAILNVYDALYKHSDEITHILTSHEQGAAHAADGYARATGKVGVCLATSGPGATNLVTGIATAYMDSIPVVAITCNVTVPLLGKDSFQEVDIQGITMPITKHNFIVKDIADLANVIRKAFRIAKSGRPGPVLIDVTKDVTAAEYDYVKETPKLIERQTDTINEDDVENAVKLIKECKKPYVFVFGIIALGIQMLIGYPLGVLMARSKGKFVDTLGNAYVLLINALPAAVYFLAIQLYLSTLLKLPMLFDPLDWKSRILPIICLSLGGIASNAMWMRRYMVDQMNMDYIRLARAKGMTSSQVAFRHVMRNAFIPMAQSLPTSLLFTISGSLYVESLFSIPGMGGLLIQSIQRQDNTMVQAMVLLYSVISVTGLLLGDIMMMICDPRIKLVKKGDSR